MRETAVTYAISGLPFSQGHVWTSGGWKTITATGHGNCGGQASTSLYVNWRPAVTLASPINGDTVVGPATIQINANASDPDGSVQYVAFYGDGALLAVDTAAPYSFQWTNVAVGAHSIWAVAVDNSSAANSAGAAVTVVDPGPELRAKGDSGRGGTDVRMRWLPYHRASWNEVRALVSEYVKRGHARNNETQEVRTVMSVGGNRASVVI